MIGRLTGTLAAKTPPQVLLDVGGVGYEVDVPMSSFYNLPGLGERVTLLTHFVVREDAQVLFGFLTHEERTTFRLLVKISGVGPRTALSILSGLSVDELARAVGLQDSGRLIKVPGIGKKTAERLLLELKGKLGDAVAAPASVDLDRAGRHPAGARRARLQRPRGDGDAEDAARRRRGRGRNQARPARPREVTRRRDSGTQVLDLNACGLRRRRGRRGVCTTTLTSTVPACSNWSVIGKVAPSLSGSFKPTSIRCIPIPGRICSLAFGARAMPSISRIRITPSGIDGHGVDLDPRGNRRAGANQLVGARSSVLERRQIGGAGRRAGERRRRERMDDRDVADVRAVRKGGGRRQQHGQRRGATEATCEQGATGRIHDGFLIERAAFASQIEAKLGVKGPLRVGMERPVAVVVDVVDPGRDQPRTAQAVPGTEIDDEEFAEAGVGVAVAVGVVELAVLS